MKITGKVDSIIFYNDSNGYTIISIISGKNEIVAVGETHELEIGDELELNGDYVTHKLYGQQFKFTTYIKIMPKTKSSLITYIADNIKGVGKKTARLIVDRFEDDTIDVIKNRPDLLAEIKGMTEEKIDNIQIHFNEQWEKWNVFSFLATYGVSVITASKIYENLKEDTIEIIKNNPYSLLKYVKNIDFKVVDNIGLSTGIEKDSTLRLEFGILHVLNTITEFGHTCVIENILIHHATKFLEVQSDQIINTLISLQMEDKIYIEEIDTERLVFRKAFYIAESNIAKFVAIKNSIKSEEKDYLKEIDTVSETHSLVLSKEQTNAIETSLNNSFTIISGGPGTGKTTIIRCIIDMLENMKKTYVLAAPTGRAAKRITETTGKEAKTLHRLLEIIKIDDRDLESVIEYNVKPIDEDVLIVDEASMIDTVMMNNLVKAVSKNTKIILVGDVNQLPSVGAGSVLKDLINSEAMPVIFLKHIYRQSLQSDIVINAHRVNEGKHLEFKSKETDLFFIPSVNEELAINEITSLISYRLESYATLDVLKDLQILVPTKKNELGVHNLNKIVQNVLNPKLNEKYEKEINSKIFRTGDKIMQIVNNYDREFEEDGVRSAGIYNGDIGYITEIDNVKEVVKIVFDDTKCTEYKFEDLEEIEHAYAITIHKSQGSEYDYVILPILNGYTKLFTRNLLYTAMTRAKKMLIIIGSRKMLNFMAENIEEKNRKTGLTAKIKKNEIY